MTPQELSLDCEALEEFRTSLDFMIRRMTEALVERKLETGTISAKIKVALKEEEGRDGQPVYVMQIAPDVGMKIGANGKMKCKEQNGILLKYTEDGQPIVGEKQLEIEEYIREKTGRAWSA